MLFLAKVVAAFIWAIVGLLLWIPMIVRAFAIQTGMLLLSAVTDTDASKYDNWFSQVVQFYPKGFARIFENSPPASAEEAIDIKFSRALIEIVFAAIFYVSTLFLYQFLFSGSTQFRSGFIADTMASFWGEDKEVIIYSDAKVIQDYQNSGLFSSTPQRAEFHILRLTAPTSQSSAVTLHFRVCNVGQNSTKLTIYAYYTDTSRQTFRWESVELDTIEPGACSESQMASESDRAWSEMNFRQGTFTFRFGNVTTNINVR